MFQADAEKWLAPEKWLSTEYKWFSPDRSPFVLEGFPFYEKEGIYRRLSLNPPKPLPALVNERANCTSGGQIRFHGRFKKLVIRVHLSTALTLDHFSPGGQCGFDCYLSQDGSTPRFYSSSRIFDFAQSSYEDTLVDLPMPKDLEVVLHFPPYAGVHQILLGFDPDVQLSPPAPRKDNRRIVMYGTSITQGAYASRPGTVVTNILARKLNREFINLGFDSSGKCEEEAALAIRDVERTGMLIMDNNPNCHTGQWISEKYPIFLRLYRERYPDIPILVLSRYHFSKDLLLDEQLCLREETHHAIEKAVQDQIQSGDKHIFFIDGATLFPQDEFEEYTVDGVHATDLGFYKLAQALFPIIQEHLPE